MAYNNLTGAPKIVTPAGETLELPIPDSERFMKSDAVDESNFETQAIGLRRTVMKELRNVFEFGYECLPIDKATALVRIYETHPTFTFFPRTVSASDPASSVATSYKVRVASPMPFVVRADGLFPVDLRFEQVGEIVVGNNPALFMAIEDSLNEAEGTGIYQQTLDLDFSNYQKITSLSDAEVPPFAGMVPINENRELLFVKSNDLNTIHMISLDDPESVSVWAVGPGSHDWIDFGLDETAKEIYIAWNVTGTDNDIVRVYDYSGNLRRTLGGSYDQTRGVCVDPNSNDMWILETKFWMLRRYNKNDGIHDAEVWRHLSNDPTFLQYDVQNDKLITVEEPTQVAIMYINNSTEQTDPTGTSRPITGTQLIAPYPSKLDNKLYFVRNNLAKRADSVTGNNEEAVQPSSSGNAKCIVIYEPAGGTTAP